MALFNFGLSTAQEQRASEIHSTAIVFDWLSQHVGGSNIFEAYPADIQNDLRELLDSAESGTQAYADAIYWPYDVALAGRSTLVEDWYRESGLTCGTYGVPVGEAALSLGGFDRFNEFTALPWLRLVTTAAEVRSAKAEGAVAFYGHWQPIVPIPQDLGAIDAAYDQGLRSLMLTYNRMDNVGVGCTERVDAGLSMFGLDVVRHSEERGILIDTSHCGPATTLDACKVAKGPVNANHTLASALSPVARAKSDDALKAIAATGGVIGVVAVPFFLSTMIKSSIETLLDQIDYISDLVGWQHVSIGTDWPMQAPMDVQRNVLGPAAALELGFRPEDRVDVADRLVGFDDYRDLRNITRGLVNRSYSDEQIIGILGENAMRVFAEVCG